MTKIIKSDKTILYEECDQILAFLNYSHLLLNKNSFRINCSCYCAGSETEAPAQLIC